MWNTLSMNSLAQADAPPVENEAGEIDERFDAVLIFSMINIMLFGPTVWYSISLGYLIALPALVSKRIRHSPWTWVAMAAVLAQMIIVHWATADNHKYVMTYWSLAIALSLFVPQKNRIEVLATNACWILGLSMLFATIWKLISPEYVNGAFFEILFLTDPRLSGTVSLLTDLTPGQLLDNRNRVLMMTEGYMKHLNPESVELHTSNLVHVAALLATWWTVAIEGLKAALFLLPINGQRMFFLRNLVLIVFCFSTYAIAPVPGFGCSLTSMGMATCVDRGKIWFRLYAVCFVYVVVAWQAAEPIRKALYQLFGAG